MKLKAKIQKEKQREIVSRKKVKKKRKLLRNSGIMRRNGRKMEQEKACCMFTRC